MTHKRAPRRAPNFAAAVPDEARSGTLQNMLGTAVLDAAEFPAITVKSLRITAVPDAANPGR